mmetsp:Transcript_24728/g.68361  ORF Transcript_24728/g.68361 Transcript_24728/m.68361 type:complete len:935 (+) Transcript_24728:194-2998(+)
MKQAIVCILDLSHSMATRTWGNTAKTTRLESAKDSMLGWIEKVHKGNPDNECSVVLLQTPDTRHHLYEQPAADGNSNDENPCAHLTHMTEKPVSGIEPISQSFLEDLKQSIPTRVGKEGKKIINGGDFAQGILLGVDALTRKTCNQSGKPLEGWKRCIVLWTDTQGYNATICPSHILRAIDAMRLMDCRLCIVGLDFQHVQTEYFNFPSEAPSRANQGGGNAPDEESDESECSSEDEDNNHDDGQQPVGGENSTEEKSDAESETDASVVEEGTLDKGQAQQHFLKSIVEKTAGMILACSAVEEMGKLYDKFEEQPDILAMDEDMFEEMIVNGVGGGEGDNIEANTGIDDQNGVDGDHLGDEYNVDVDRRQAVHQPHAATPVSYAAPKPRTAPTKQSAQDVGRGSQVAAARSNTISPPVPWQPVHIAHEPWMDEIPVTRVPDLLLEPLSGFHLAQRLSKRMEDIVTKYLPCVKCFCVCTDEMNKALLDPVVRLNALDFWCHYIARVPKLFEFEFRGKMESRCLEKAVEGLKLYRTAAENSTDQDPEAVMESFLGGVMESGAWGLRKWVSECGTALSICTEIELIFSSASRTLHPHLETTKSLVRLWGPIATRVLQKLLSEVPKHFQEESPGCVILPFFGRIKSALQMVEAGFTPDGDDDDSDVLEIVEPASEEGNANTVELDGTPVVEIVDDGQGEEIENPFVVDHGPPAKRRKNSMWSNEGGWISYLGPADERAVHDFVQMFRPSQLSTNDCCWIYVRNPAAAAATQRISLQIETYQPFLKKIEDHISEGKKVPKSMKDSCIQAILSAAKAQNYTNGKWILFIPPHSVDFVWQKVAQSCVFGTGCGAKVAPCKFTQEAMICCCVYVSDFTIRSEVKRVLLALHRLLESLPEQARPRLPSFKPDIFTDLGIYQNNQWRLDPVLYRAKQVQEWHDV